MEPPLAKPHRARQALPAYDERLIRVDKQLAASLGMLRRAAEEAESFSDQALADTLWIHFRDLQLLHERMLMGRRPRTHLRSTTRI